jgi:hypothetical protein
VVFNPSSTNSFSTGPCENGSGWDYYPPNPWGSAVVCNLGSKPMLPNAGFHFQVSVGPAQPNGTTLFIGMLDSSGLDFGIPATVGQ